MTFNEKIVDLATGEETLRDYTQGEIAEVESDEAKAKLKQKTEAANAAKKSALFEKLGITEDEAKLLLS